jgi:hypothetical protein
MAKLCNAAPAFFRAQPGGTGWNFTQPIVTRRLQSLLCCAARALFRLKCITVVGAKQVLTGPRSIRPNRQPGTFSGTQMEKKTAQALLPIERGRLIPANYSFVFPGPGANALYPFIRSTQPPKRTVRYFDANLPLYDW